jgi:predicted ArsR family transcriptional regulator
MSPDGGAIELHHCPFRELAEEHPDVVCGAHLGLIQGALATSGDLTATRILPFVAPDLCLAELSRPAGA